MGGAKHERQRTYNMKKGRSRDRIHIDNKGSLKLASWDVRGLQENTKRQVLAQIMKYKQIDIMSLQETWVNTNLEEVVDGYHFIFSSGVDNIDREESIKKATNQRWKERQMSRQRQR